MTLVAVSAMAWGFAIVSLEGEASILNSVFSREVALVDGTVLQTEALPEKIGEWTYCDYEVPAKAEYSVELKNIVVSEDISTGTPFTVDFTMVNNSNSRLYADGSGCESMPTLSLGTQLKLDRTSVFGVKQRAVSGWIAPNRVRMKEDFVEPGEEFHFEFVSIAPEADNVYREFFQPVLEGVAWLDDVYNVDIEVGESTDEMKEKIKYVFDMSAAASTFVGLDGSIEVDLSEQMLYVRYGDTRVWSMQVSTGKSKTPTPTGNYSVLHKQELRVGRAYPHYRMPYWLGWRYDGYGIHALPYLGNDGGWFWQEALTHIGIPVSHGCIRVLPDNARILYEFAKVGTPVEVHK